MIYTDSSTSAALPESVTIFDHNPLCIFILFLDDRRAIFCFLLRFPTSTAIDPITRSPNYHHETSKKENISRANLCLAHSTLELVDDDLDFLKLDHLY